MTTPETTAPDTKADRRSKEIHDLGFTLIACSCVAFAGFVVSSSLEPNGFWTPVAITVSASLMGPLFIAGLLLTILALSVFTTRIRRAGIAAMLLLLLLVWYPFQGHGAVMLFAHGIDQAFLIAEQRYCLLPLIDM